MCVCVCVCVCECVCDLTFTFIFSKRILSSAKCNIFDNYVWQPEGISPPVLQKSQQQEYRKQFWLFLWMPSLTPSDCFQWQRLPLASSMHEKRKMLKTCYLADSTMKRLINSENFPTTNHNWFLWLLITKLYSCWTALPENINNVYLLTLLILSIS